MSITAFSQPDRRRYSPKLTPLGIVSLPPAGPLRGLNGHGVSPARSGVARSAALLDGDPRLRCGCGSSPLVDGLLDRLGGPARFHRLSVVNAQRSH